MYDGKLINFVSEKKGRTNNNTSGSLNSTLCEGGEGEIRKTEEVTASCQSQINKCGEDRVACFSTMMNLSKVTTFLNNILGAKLNFPRALLLYAGCSIDNEIQVVAAVVGSATLVASAAGLDESGVMPSSLSQVDMSALQELPEELRADIVGLLPAHTRPSCQSDSAKVTPETLRECLNLDHSRATEPALENKLWAGSPPNWFTGSN
ncbi:hypothetical protein Ancab_017058 [Ancistrocladus abbreviatus]